MKLKKRCILLVLALFITAITCSCGNKNTTTTMDKKEIGEDLQTYGAFISISGEEENGLFYHIKSKTVYVIFEMNMYAYSGLFSVTPYIDDGHYWQYIDGKIVPDKISTVTSEADVEVTADKIWKTLTEEEKTALLEKKGY